MYNDGKQWFAEDGMGQVGCREGAQRSTKERADNGTVHSPVTMVSKEYVYVKTNQIKYYKYVA